MCQTTFNTSIRLPYGTANEWEMLGPFAVTLCNAQYPWKEQPTWKQEPWHYRASFIY